MIIDCAVYRDGRRLPDVDDLTAALSSCVSKGGFVWIGLLEPDHAEFADVAKHLGLHPLAVEDAIHAHQRPKLETYGDMIFVVLKPARYVDHEEVVQIGQIMMFIGEHYVVSVRHGPVSALTNLRTRLEQNVELLVQGPFAVLHAVADHIVDEYASVLKGLTIDVDEIEIAVFSGPRATHAERIFKLKREVLEFRWAVDPLVGPLEELVRRRGAGRPRGVAPVLPRRPRSCTACRRSGRGAGHAARHRADARTSPRWGCARTRTCARSPRGWRSSRCRRSSPAIYGMNFESMPELGLDRSATRSHWA